MFKKKQTEGVSGLGNDLPQKTSLGSSKQVTKAVGDQAEDLALALLQSRGLRLVQRNYRVAGGPARRGAEIDLIMHDRDGTLVFVEVRSRSSRSHGGAAASISQRKQQRLVLGAQHYLMQMRVVPACRFDVVEVENGVCHWIPAAFEASS